MSITLSICIPTFNRAPYLKECLESIEVASKGLSGEIEVVVSDNAGSDNTPAVISEMKARLPHLRYSRNPVDIGAARNFYLLATMATGSHVWLFGDDDRMEPDAIRLVLDAIGEGNELVICNYSVWDRGMTTAMKSSAFAPEMDRTYGTADAFMREFHIHVGYISSLIIRKSRFLAAAEAEYSRFHDYGFSHAYSVWTGAAVDQCQARYLSTPIVRNRSGNASKNDWFEVFAIGSAVVLDALVEKGYSPSAANAAKQRVLKEFIVPNILPQNLVGVRASPRQARAMIRRYGKGWRLWLLVLPAMLVPRSVASLARSMKRALWMR